jgi:hypothetical protein
MKLPTRFSSSVAPVVILWACLWIFSTVGSLAGMPGAGRTPAATPIPNVSLPSPTEDESAQVYDFITILPPTGNFNDFGWRDNDTVYFSTMAGKLINFYTYSQTKATIQSDATREAAFSQQDFLRLNEGYRFPATDFIISPSGERIVFLRIPDSYIKPTDDPQWVLQPLPDQNYWVASEHGNQMHMVPSSFYPYSLLPSAHWYQSEEVVLGEELPIEGPTGFFLLHTITSQIISDGDFSTSKDNFISDPVYTPELDSLAYVDSRGTLWVERQAVPFDWNARAQNTSAKIISYPQDRIASPEWSADGKWVYYWRGVSTIQITDPIEMTLERYNPDTHQTETILSKTILNRLLCPQGSNIFYPLMTGIDWRLAENGRALALLDTQGGKIFLLAW